MEAYGDDKSTNGVGIQGRWSFTALDALGVESSIVKKTPALSSSGPALGRSSYRSQTNFKFEISDFRDGGNRSRVLDVQGFSGFGYFGSTVVDSEGLCAYLAFSRWVD